MAISTQAQAHLDFIRKECQKIDARISAYERKAYDEIFESMNPIGTQLAAEGLSDEIDAEIAAELKVIDEQLDNLNDRLNDVEGNIGERIRTLNQERMDKAREYNEKRKKMNAGNFAKGFWPMYGGVFFGVVIAVAAREAGLGMTGCLLGGVCGYAAGSYIMNFLSTRISRQRIDPAEQEAAKAELDAIHEEHKSMSEEINTLQDTHDIVAKTESLIEELQDFIQDALNDFEE